MNNLLELIITIAIVSILSYFTVSAGCSLFDKVQDIYSYDVSYVFPYYDLLF